MPLENQLEGNTCQKTAIESTKFFTSDAASVRKTAATVRNKLRLSAACYVYPQ
jgi:hypothetical protein